MRALLQLLLFINPSDFDATEPALLSQLQHSPRGGGTHVRPSQLRMTLQQHASGEPRLVSIADLMHMSHEAWPPPPHRHVGNCNGFGITVKQYLPLVSANMHPDPAKSRPAASFGWNRRIAAV